MADLENVGLVNSLRRAVITIIESNKSRIDKTISNYSGPNGAYKLVKVWNGRRPERKLQGFPCVSVVTASRTPQWDLSRTANNTIGFRIFTCVMGESTEKCEELMSDFTDAITAVLYENPRVAFSVLHEGSPVSLMTSDVVVSSITYGQVDSGYIRAGQIDVSYELFVTHTQFADML